MSKRILFVGPDAKHLNLQVSERVIERLVYNYIDFAISNEGIDWVSVRPDTGFAEIVARAIRKYKEDHPDSCFKLQLESEFNDYFEQLPVEVQQVFYDLVKKDDMPERVEDYNYRICVGRYFKSQAKSAYKEFLSGWQNVIYYHNYDLEEKLNKHYQCEMNVLLNRSWERINLYEVIKPEYYNQNCIRKRANATSFYYRINLKLPNGTPIHEEQGGYSCKQHAYQARQIRLKNILQQEVRIQSKTLDDVFWEYIETLGEKEPLKKKYISYLNSFYDGPRDIGIEEFSNNLLQNRNSYIKPYCRSDNRLKGDKQYTRSISHKYRKSYLAFLNNLLDYAYLNGYISIQPLYLN